MRKSKKKKLTLKKVWYFIWEDDSIWSWIVNIILAFVLIKFIVYPGLGFALQTTHPVVAVVSESMEHNSRFNDWWYESNDWYVSNEITKDQFNEFPLKNGFDKGDIMVLMGKNAEEIEVGEVIVFWSTRRDPIIHRVVYKWEDNGDFFFQTKGDNYQTNPIPIRSPFLDETRINEKQIIGKAVLKIPFLGYIKIWFVDLVNVVGDIAKKG
jgi:signal peptidase I